MKLFIVTALAFTSVFLQAQPDAKLKPVSPPGVNAKPFKILTNGRQITIQAKENLKSLLVWTSSGHRFVEEKTLSSTHYSFTVPAKEKICFIMIETNDAKRFTEKIGVQ